MKKGFANLLLLTAFLVAAPGLSFAEPFFSGFTSEEDQNPSKSLLNKSSPPTATNLHPIDVERYRRALEDAKVTEQSKIVHDLIAVVPEPDATNYRKLQGDDLVWEDFPANADHPRVLVAAVMSRKAFNDYYRAFIGRDYKLPVSLWVTAVPELKNLAIGKSCPPTSKRLVEALGLNPGLEYSAIIEMWVDPKNLFRPAPDPDINDHEAELAYLQDDFESLSFPGDRSFFLTFDQNARFLESFWSKAGPLTFRDWFKALLKTQYRMDGDISKWGFPWTRLGYTYDWGNPDNHVGLSEFILRIDPELKYADVTIQSGFTEDDTELWASYFRCGPAAPRLEVNTQLLRTQLKWNRSPEAKGYTILYRPTERGKAFTPPFTDMIDVGNRQTFSIRLPQGGSYYFAVQGYNFQGRGGLSNIEYVHLDHGSFRTPETDDE